MQGPLLKGHLLVKELYRYFIYYHNFKTIFTTNLKDNETFSGVDTDLQRKHETWLKHTWVFYLPILLDFLSFIYDCRI